MARFGFTGSSYSPQVQSLDAQDLINFYFEPDESGAGKSQGALCPTPGLSLFSTLSGTKNRGIFTINGLLFSAVGSSLYQIDSAGVATNLGPIGNDGNPVSMAASPTQVAIASSGTLYCYNINTHVLSTPAGLLGNVSQCEFCDGYFIALLKDTQKFQISALEDATSWDALDIAQISVFSDNILSMKVDHREIWFYGLKETQVYYNSGNADFPFDVVASGFIEQGCSAEFSPVRLDNSVFWLGGDERGARVAWRANGYTPTRVSNYAVEYAWSRYSTVSDAVAYAYQDQGHSFWQITFPTANATWVYDASTGQWFKKGFWNTLTSSYDMHRSLDHAYCFNKHLVGDSKSGNIYEMNISNYTDFNNLIRRMRRAPYVSKAGEYITFSSFELMMDTGLALQGADATPPVQGSNPVVSLRWSDDNGRTWSNPVQMSAGTVGQYSTRMFARRLGKCWGSIGRVFEVVVSDPVAWRLCDADLIASDYQSQERLASLVRKTA